MRVALFTDLGLAEAFMFGDVDCEDISSLIQILIANRHEIENDSILTSFLSKGRSLTSKRFLGILVNSKANISAHYDLGNTMFSAYLSQDMNYSSAIFENYNEDLDPAAAAKGVAGRCATAKSQYSLANFRRFILKKSKIRSGQRVLEIGTGWGSLAILAAKTFNCTVETVTLSSNQAALARKRIEEANLTDRITVHCMDFREYKSKPEYWHRCSVNIGPHYARTLREWKRLFIANWEGTVAKALVLQYYLDVQGLGIFRRKWICHFVRADVEPENPDCIE
ncbi:CFS1-like protein [Mycena sanguinolenta]|uniref:CFS1-like protein n=1 Tax=Mycena sanguinolenta TaxID=230812 RepID=A0A8H6YC82_9AGAR|nr:CFS1-like protein [Mycena sanguinolenta]